MPKSTAFNAENSEHANKWRWFIALGIVLIALGAAAWLDVVSIARATTIVIGASMLVGGIAQIIHAYMARDWPGLVFARTSGLFYVVGGLLIMREPIHGAAVLTLALGALIIAAGIVRMALAVASRGIRGWTLVFTSGVVSVIVGVLLYMMLPWSSMWTLGALIGIELLVQGGGWLYFGIALGRFRRTSA